MGKETILPGHLEESVVQVMERVSREAGGIGFPDTDGRIVKGRMKVTPKPGLPQILARLDLSLLETDEEKVETVLINEDGEEIPVASWQAFNRGQ